MFERNIISQFIGIPLPEGSGSLSDSDSDSGSDNEQMTQKVQEVEPEISTKDLILQKPPQFFKDRIYLINEQRRARPPSDSNEALSPSEETILSDPNPAVGDLQEIEQNDDDNTDDFDFDDDFEFEDDDFFLADDFADDDFADDDMVEITIIPPPSVLWGFPAPVAIPHAPGAKLRPLPEAIERACHDDIEEFCMPPSLDEDPNLHIDDYLTQDQVFDPFQFFLSMLRAFSDRLSTPDPDVEVITFADVGIGFDTSEPTDSYADSVSFQNFAPDKPMPCFMGEDTMNSNTLDKPLRLDEHLEGPGSFVPQNTFQPSTWDNIKNKAKNLFSRSLSAMPRQSRAVDPDHIQIINEDPRSELKAKRGKYYSQRHRKYRKQNKVTSEIRKLHAKTHGHPHHGSPHLAAHGSPAAHFAGNGNTGISSLPFHPHHSDHAHPPKPFGEPQDSSTEPFFGITDGNRLAFPMHDSETTPALDFEPHFGKTGPFVPPHFQHPAPPLEEVKDMFSHHKGRPPRHGTAPTRPLVPPLIPGASPIACLREHFPQLTDTCSAAINGFNQYSVSQKDPRINSYLSDGIYRSHPSISPRSVAHMNVELDWLHHSLFFLLGTLSIFFLKQLFTHKLSTDKFKSRAIALPVRKNPSVSEVSPGAPSLDAAVEV